MKDYVFTFGFNQHMGPDRIPLANHYTIIPAETESEARNKMYEKRKAFFAFCYESKESAGVDKWNLIFIDFDKVLHQYPHPGGPITIDNWRLVPTNPDCQYMAPETLEFSLAGRVSNHHRHQDGKSIMTSAIKGYKIEDGQDLIVTKSGSTYKLGEVQKEYEEKFPDAENRLWKRIKETCSDPAM